MIKAGGRVYALALVSLVLLAGCGKSATSGGSAGTMGGGGAASNAGTVKAIQDKIAADKDLAGAHITVTQQGNTISLEGTVAAVVQKDKAEQIVLETQKEQHQQPGVMDNLMVQEGKSQEGGSVSDNR